MAQDLGSDEQLLTGETRSGERVPPVVPTSQASRARRAFFWIGIAFGALVAIAIALLIVQNPESADFEWLSFDFRSALWLMLFVSFVAGAITVLLAELAIRRARSHRVDRQALVGGSASGRSSRGRRQLA